MKKSVFLIIFFLTFGWTETAFTIDGNQYPDEIVYREVPEHEWLGLNADQKQRLIDDMIRKKLGAYEAKALLLDQTPKNQVKLRNQRERLLVNTAYEEFVAKPLVTDERIASIRQYMREEVLVNHILVSYKGCNLKVPVNRTKEAAKDRIDKAWDEYHTGVDFADLAMKYSDDPSVSRNQGKLGWLQAGKASEEFQDACFKTAAGEISKPVLSEYGYHIVFIEERRPSQFADLDDQQYEDEVNKSARASIYNLLRPAAEEYDKSVAETHLVKFNQNALLKIVEGFKKEQEKSRIVGKSGRIDVVEALNSFSDAGVVCVVDGRGFGVKWFADRIDRIPTSRHPELDSVETAEYQFNRIILQELAVEKAKEHQLFEDSVYQSGMEEYEGHILYDSFVKYIVNNLADPTEDEILDYYDANRDEKYMDGKKAVAREIKVYEKTTADSIYEVLKAGSDFETIARTMSLTRPKEGGLLDPFTSGKYNVMGAAAFKLQPGEFSEPVENLEGTWSIVYLHEFLPEAYKPLDQVRNKISQILKREQQTQAKDDVFDTLRTKYNVVVNPDFFQYPEG